MTDVQSVTIADVVRVRIGGDASPTPQQVSEQGFPIFAGCQLCGASLAFYNSYPSRTGYIRCSDCVGSLGFISAADFEEWM